MLTLFLLMLFQAELEEAVHRLELEKAKLEAALDHEQQKTDMLQRDLTESQKVKSINQSLDQSIINKLIKQPCNATSSERVIEIQ